MSKISAIYQAFLSENIVMPYFTLGDPDTAHTKACIEAAFEAGAQAIEIGIPFSDPIADGPVIQASHHRALSTKEDVSVKVGFEFVADLKKAYPSKGIFLMLSVNLVLAYGIEAFFKKGQSVNLDGVIIPDLSLESSKNYLGYATQYAVPINFLVSPLTDVNRLTKMIRHSKGFVYLISSLGTTGEKSVFDTRLNSVIKRIRSLKTIPIIIGFGISTPKQAKEMGAQANGVIIGSKLVRIIADSKGVKAAKDAVYTFVSNCVKSS